MASEYEFFLLQSVVTNVSDVSVAITSWHGYLRISKVSPLHVSMDCSWLQLSLNKPF